MNQCDQCGQGVYEDGMSCGQCGFSFCSRECQIGHGWEHGGGVEDSAAPDDTDPLVAEANQILAAAGFNV